MIIKGTSCAGAKRLAAHLTRTDTNERAEVLEIKGTVSETLSGALKEMEAVAAGTRCSKPFYHASINTPVEERLSDEQRAVAIDRLEEALGLTGQARVVVLHEKEGREHCHIVWSRIDLEKMRAVSDSNNYRKHEEVARALEREFGHERVQGAHVERGDAPRPERTPSHAEMLQAERTGISPQDAKELLTGIWQGSKNGKEFVAALEEKGWTLARGDRRDFVAIDAAGGVHSIARRIDGARVADIRERFADLDPAKLRSVAEATAFQRKQHADRNKEAGPSRIPKMGGKAFKLKPASSKDDAVQARGPNERGRTPGVGSAVGLANGLFSALLGETPTPRPKPTTPPTQEMDAEAQRRQDLMRQLSREITPETQRDAEIERDRGRERDRG